ncbi:MAG: ribosome biogenesis GTPase Der, partial [Paracoccus sp. (in: a-proteobacteria)]
VDEADICLFVVDARVGVTAADEYFAEILRKRARHVIVAANKAEGMAGEAGALEAWSLGLGEPLRISAEHGEGMDDLYRVLMPLADRVEAERPEPVAALTDVDLSEADAASGEGAEEWRPSDARPLQLAVIGRPNAGKSTLINKIIGETRLLTGPEAGITRDSISVATTFMGTPMRIFDTAGMRKRARITDKIEKLSVADGLRAVRFAEVVVVLLDVAIPFEQQDLRIADFAETEGRAVVVAANKWDLEDDKPHKLNELRASFERLLPQLKGAPLVTVSARTGKGLDRLHAAVIKAHEVWNRRVSTAKLNRWLEAMTESHPPPAPGGRRIRLRYMTQVKTRPPAFIVKATHTDKLPDSYQRYLVNGLRVDFDMPGTPIRLFFRDQGGDNPYRAKAGKISQSGALSKHRVRQKPKGG